MNFCLLLLFFFNFYPFFTFYCFYLFFKLCTCFTIYLFPCTYLPFTFYLLTFFLLFTLIFTFTFYFCFYCYFFLHVHVHVHVHVYVHWRVDAPRVDGSETDKSLTTVAERQILRGFQRRFLPFRRFCCFWLAPDFRLTTFVLFSVGTRDGHGVEFQCFLWREEAALGGSVSFGIYALSQKETLSSQSSRASVCVCDGHRDA